MWRAGVPRQLCPPSAGGVQQPPSLGRGSGRFSRVKICTVQPRKEDPPTYAGGDGRAALLVALGAAVAGDAGDTVLAGTLARGLVAGLAGGTHGVTIALCGGNTRQQGQGRAQRGQAAMWHRRGAGQLPRHGSTSLPLTLQLRQTSPTELKQSWHLSQGVGTALGHRGQPWRGGGPVTAPLRRWKCSRDVGAREAACGWIPRTFLTPRVLRSGVCRI